MTSLQQNVQSILDGSGIVINGQNPWDIQVKNDDFFRRVLTQGSLGFGESYMDGWWECDQIDELIARLFSIDIQSRLKKHWKEFSLSIASTLLNRQAGKRAYKIGEEHYDVGNDLYRAMLGPRMVYTCGYWVDANSLDQAQDAKLDLVCRKIGLKKGDRVLDIGCGWGSFAKFAAEKYGVHVVGITVSKEQLSLGQKMCAGLDVELRYQDYRDVHETFDHIISLGMIEHVGYKNYRTYMEVVARCLKEDGLFLLHTIGGTRSVKSTDPWIEKYIFPNSMLPSLAQLTRAAEKLFVVEDVHNFGADYDKTLMAWFQNFDVYSRNPSPASNPPPLFDIPPLPEGRVWVGREEGGLDRVSCDRFYRMWKYYLLSCAGSFRSRRNQLWQIILSKHGVCGGYPSIR